MVKVMYNKVVIWAFWGISLWKEKVALSLLIIMCRPKVIQVKFTDRVDEVYVYIYKSSISYLPT